MSPWIKARNADIERLRAAFDRVKEFPEFQPDERVRWLELRQAVEQFLERHSPR